MASLMITVLGASLLGSLHCAGMCGPLVAFAVGTAGPAGRRWPLLHVAYHGGRLSAYAVLGAISGLIGAAVNRGGALVGLQHVAAVVAGSLMVAVGFMVLLRSRGLKVGRGWVPPGLQRVITLGQQAAIGLQPTPRAAAMGLLSALLPCGWLYLFAVTAAGTGNPAWGALVMVAFWTGTVPVLLAVGLSVHGVARRLGVRLPLVTSLALVVLGMYTIAGRLQAHIPVQDVGGATATTTDDAMQRVQSLDSTQAPCCRNHGR